MANDSEPVAMDAASTSEPPPPSNIPLPRPGSASAASTLSDTSDHCPAKLAEAEEAFNATSTAVDCSFEEIISLATPQNKSGKDGLVIAADGMQNPSMTCVALYVGTWWTRLWSRLAAGTFFLH